MDDVRDVIDEVVMGQGAGQAERATGRLEGNLKQIEVDARLGVTASIEPPPHPLDQTLVPKLVDAGIAEAGCSGSAIAERGRQAVERVAVDAGLGAAHAN